ncbi:MAG: hypothetical protein WCF73_06335 [Candidatus Sulfotelmatobacter sp.]|jgi:hypothetical protein
MHKWYFCSVDGPNITWEEKDRERAFKFSSKGDAERDTKLLNSGHHLIPQSDGGARLWFHNFRIEEAGQNNFLICFDAEPESSL